MRRGFVLGGTKIKSLLLDMDGVIVDSEKAWLRAFNDTLKNFGSAPISEKTYLEKYSKYGSVPIIISMLRKDYCNQRLDEKAVEYCNSRFSDMVADVRLFPGAKETVGNCRKRFRMALVTNTKKLDVFRILKNLDIEKYFDVIVTSDDVKKGKPDPELILKACKVLRTKPKNAALVGDSLSDMEAGKAAGCFFIGVGISGDMRIGSIAELDHELCTGHS